MHYLSLRGISRRIRGSHQGVVLVSVDALSIFCSPIPYGDGTIETWHLHEVHGSIDQRSHSLQRLVAWGLMVARLVRADSPLGRCSVRRSQQAKDDEEKERRG
jgi:hypothetical protein